MENKPQLTLIESQSFAKIPISVKAYNALAVKAEATKSILEILEQVYCRGYLSAGETSINTLEQQGFARVNSFINNGKAYRVDKDLAEQIEAIKPLAETPCDKTRKTIEIIRGAIRRNKLK